MRFKDFLAEERLRGPSRHRKSISAEDAERLLKAHCSDALKNYDEPIWRGFSGQEEAYLIHAEASSRASANSTNHYTVIMDHFLPALGYPKRGASIICANTKNEDAAAGFGSVYAIFPYDGVKIGVCSDKDFWLTERFKIGEARVARRPDDWNDWFRNCDIPDYSYEDLVQAIREGLDPDDEHYDIISDVFNGPSRVERYLKEAYSPETLRLNLATTSNIDKYNDIAREVWVGGKCVALDKQTWAVISKKFGYNIEPDESDLI